MEKTQKVANSENYLSSNEDEREVRTGRFQRHSQKASCDLSENDTKGYFEINGGLDESAEV